MALENFTAYTEVDPNSKITLAPTRVTWASLHRDEIAYVYDDKTAGYFAGNFEIKFTVRLTAFVASCFMYFVSLSNLVGDLTDDSLAVHLVVTTGGTGGIRLLEYDGGTPYQYICCPATAGTPYYCTFKRDETVGTYGTVYLFVYSDYARTTALCSQARALHSSKKDFRYLYACMQPGGASSVQTCSGYIEALEVTLATTPTVTTEPCTAISTTTATGNGSIVSLGSSSVSQHGHCWATTVNPTTSDTKTSNGAGSLGNFTSSITGLTQGITYYVRAYATNSAGTYYGANAIITKAGLPSSQLTPKEIAVGSTVFLYTGRDGKRYYVQGVEF